MADPRRRADLVLHNANVLTLNERRPRAEAVAVRSGRIALVGSNADVSSVRSAGARSIDCAGQTLVPGFVDAHVHLMAYAASLVAVDCRPQSASSIRALQDALRARAAATPPGQWVRGAGYDELALAKGRHPTRWDLDEAVPHHPVRLGHRSGHACVLNSAAMDRVGLGSGAVEPPGATMSRDLESGEPDGLLLEPDAFLAGRIPPLPGDEMDRGLREADRRLVSMGITSLHDAGPSTSPAHWDAFKRLKDAGRLAPRLTAMAGAPHLDELLRRGLGHGSGDSGLRLSHAKIMLTASSGRLHPPADEMAALVERAHEAGFPVAVHAVEAEAVDAAVDALLAARESRPDGPKDRIEHCSECPPAVLDKLAAADVMVVTQPSFIYHGGGRYLSEATDAVRPWLYPIGSLRRAGVEVALSSDAPVVEPDPLTGIYAAVARRAASGETVAWRERVSAREALWMHTMGGARASGSAARIGSIEAGKLADLVLLDRDPTRVDPDEIPDIQPMLTLIGGSVLFQR